MNDFTISRYKKSIVTRAQINMTTFAQEYVENRYCQYKFTNN